MSAAAIDSTEIRSLANYIPILGWAKTYDVSGSLRPDILAGLTVAAFSVPESMAYAGLAGLTPEHGLYASMLALLVYCIFGTSRHMSVGTTSALSIMVAGSLGGITFANTGDYVAAAQLTAIIAGGMAIVAGILKLGFIVNFISESVLTGFSAGAALYIASSQLSKLFGIEGVQGNFFERIRNVIENIDETNGWTLALGVTCLIGLLGLEKLLPGFPTSLIVVLAAIGLMYVTNLEERGVAVAGHIPSGLPGLGFPSIDIGILTALLGLAFGCFLLSYIEGVSVARTFAAREHEKTDANAELIANGAINIGSGVFKGFPVGGSMSRSAVNAEAGARTPLASGMAGLLLAVVLLFLTAPFGKLPETTLAAVVLVAVRSLLDIPALKRLWNLSRPEFWAAALTMAGVLCIGMLEGILIGAGFSLLSVMWRVSRPKVSTMGLVPGTNQFGDVARNPQNSAVRGAQIFRVDNDFFYANAEQVMDEILESVDASEEKLGLVALDLSNTPALDLSALGVIERLDEELASRGIALKVVNATGEVRDVLNKAPELAAVNITAKESLEELMTEWQENPATIRVTVATFAPEKD